MGVCGVCVENTRRVWEDSDNDEVSDAGVYLMVIGLCGAVSWFF